MNKKNNGSPGVLEVNAKREKVDQRMGVWVLGAAAALMVDLREDLTELRALAR